MPEITTLTPKDCLYIEDICNATCLLIKRSRCEMEKVQEEQVRDIMQRVCEELKNQYNDLLTIMEGAK